jgi:hypothetical protein
VIRRAVRALGARAAGAVGARLARPRAAKQAWDVRRDYRRFRRTEARVLAGGGGRAAKRVLLVSLTDWVAQVKLEAVLARALELYGYRPVVLTSRRAARARRYFAACGVTDLVCWEDLVEAVGPAPADAVTVGERPGLAALLARQHRGVDIGRHALSSFVRATRVGTLDLADPATREGVERSLVRSARIVPAAEALVDRCQPDMALFLEKGYTPYGEIFDVLLGRGVNVIQWLHAQRADALVLKRYTPATRHVHPFSLAPETWTRVKGMPWSEAHAEAIVAEIRAGYEGGTWFSRKFLQVGKRLKPPEEVRRQLGLDPARKTAVVFSHVLWDATFFYGDNLFGDYEEWLVETVRAACANPALNWVIKLHPDYVWKLKQAGLPPAAVRDQLAIHARIGRLPPHVTVLPPDTDISTFALFPLTEFCLTVRGTIGIEMPCFGIPVLTAGSGRYSGLGFTIDSASREEYLDRLARLPELDGPGAERTELARRHAYALFRLRPCVFRTFELVQAPLARLGHPLDHNLVLRARSPREFAEAEDVNAFATWACHSEALDFLAADGAPVGQTTDGGAG